MTDGPTCIRENVREISDEERLKTIETKRGRKE